jgi:hypothetical protein
MLYQKGPCPQVHLVILPQISCTRSASSVRRSSSISNCARISKRSWIPSVHFDRNSRNQLRDLRAMRLFTSAKVSSLLKTAPPVSSDEMTQNLPIATSSWNGCTCLKMKEIEILFLFCGKEFPIPIKAHDGVKLYKPSRERPMMSGFYLAASTAFRAAKLRKSITMSITMSICGCSSVVACRMLPVKRPNPHFSHTERARNGPPVC